MIGDVNASRLQELSISHLLSFAKGSLSVAQSSDSALQRGHQQPAQDGTSASRDLAQPKQIQTPGEYLNCMQMYAKFNYLFLFNV